MGSSRWSPDDWTAYASTTKGKDRATVFASRSIKSDLDPTSISLRESVDSDANPNSTPIIVALDVTGSMGEIPHQLIQGNLGTLMEEILARKPVADPHLMFMGVGDADFDRAPLQVTQFEADIKIAKQLRDIYIEGGGGGNSCESYNLPWYFAAMKTSIDSMAKRGKKGYLFTIGDEEPPASLRASQVKSVLGDTLERDLTSAEALEMAERMYHVFHIVVEQGNHYRNSRNAEQVRSKWRDLLGQRVIMLSNYEHLAEVIVSTIQMNEGDDRAAVTSSWTGDTSLVVAHALKGLTVDAASDGGLVLV
jgi:hypothetical protein